MKKSNRSRTPQASVSPVLTTGFSPSLRIVGIGASAGGLEALSELLRHLPVQTGAAFVLVQHLDPTHRSLLSELLGRTTKMPVREITNNCPVVANHIYVIPPNCDLSVSHGHLLLSPRNRAGGPARSIDRFLESLAADQKERAIAVILSGAGSDGAAGLKAVKEQGGITFAQDDESAKYNSMPRHAVATGCVDFVLPPEKIGLEVARIVREPGATKSRAAANAKKRGESVGSAMSDRADQHGIFWPAPPNDTNLRKIFQLVRTRMGLDLSFYKTSTIHRRLSRRMALNKVKSKEAYLKFLRENPGEVEAFYQDCLIHVTSFFRNPSAYEVLKRKIFPKLVRANAGNEPVRIWVAGCSTGQEAYSIAMAYAEFAEKDSVSVPIQIFASDVNGAVLEQARAGRYSKADLKQVPLEHVRRFFHEEESTFRVQKFLRDQIIFAQQNLILDPPFTRVDLISCRNMLIYLDHSLQKKIFQTFHHALKPGGFLWLGTSETTTQSGNLFHCMEKKHKVFVKKPAATWLRFDRPPTLPRPRDPVLTFDTPQRPPEFNVLDAQKEADRLILTKFAPVSVLINEDWEILQFRGNGASYLDLPTGKASFNLLKMAREGLAMPLQRLVSKAIKDGRPIRERAIRFSGGKKQVDVQVMPLKNVKARCFLVLFEKPAPRLRVGDSKRREITVEANPLEESKVVGQLRHELNETREHLHSLQEEHETAVEELQASNEEVQSSNEELQSLNEELETSNEELESGNEELTTLNEELATRNAELRESERRLREQAQLLEMAPIMARSTKEKIIFWSGGAEAMYGFSRDEALGQLSHILLQTEHGEPLAKIYEKLHRDGSWTGQCLHRRKDGQKIHVASQWVLHRDDQNKVRAILEVTTDVTARIIAEKALKESEEFNRTILQSSPDCIVVLDLKARVVFMSPAGLKLMGITDPAMVLNHYWTNLWPVESRGQVDTALRKACEGKNYRFQGLCATMKGEQKWWDVVVTPIPGENGKTERVLAVARDVTLQKQEEKQKELQVRLNAARTEIVVALARPGEVRPILQEVTEILVRYFDAAFARIWTLNEGDQVLELQASAGMYRHLNGAHSKIKVGDFKIGRIAKLRRPHFTNDVNHDPEISDPDWARREGMVSFAGCPLLVAGSVVGVIALFGKQPMDETVRRELFFAADAVAQFVQRGNADAGRRQAQESLNRYTIDLEQKIAVRTASLQETIGELEAFSYSVSHDLRTPLRAMEGYAKAVLEDCRSKLGPEQVGYLERIIRGAERLDRLTLDVLAYSRLSQAEIKTDVVDLAKLVRDVIDQYAQFESAKSLIKVEGPLLPVKGHQAFLTQCISNLLGNALKFVPAGRKPKIRIYTKQYGGKVRLVIADNGIGIAEAHRARIFQIFGRVHHEKAYEGTGIGLAIVKRATERMGGQVGFESTVGKGSRFWIELPAV